MVCLMNYFPVFTQDSGGQDIWGIGHQLDTIEFDLDFSSMGLRHEFRQQKPANNAGN